MNLTWAAWRDQQRGSLSTSPTERLHPNLRINLLDLSCQPRHNHSSGGLAGMDGGVDAERVAGESTGPVSRVFSIRPSSESQSTVLAVAFGRAIPAISPVSERPGHVAPLPDANPLAERAASDRSRPAIVTLVVALAASLLLVLARGAFDFGAPEAGSLIAMAQRDLDQGRRDEAFARMETYLSSGGAAEDQRGRAAAILSAVTECTWTARATSVRWRPAWTSADHDGAAGFWR